MFKDYNKYLSASLKVYLFVLIIIFILKLVGLDYFGLTNDAGIFGKINSILPNDALYNIYSYLLLYFNTFIIISISCNDNSSKLRLYVILTYPISFFISILPYFLTSTIIYFIINFVYLLIMCLIYNRFKNIKQVVKRNAIFSILNFIYQFISVITRNATINNIENSFLTTFILNLDYIMLLIITYKLYFKIGGEKIWYHYQVVEVGSFLQKKLDLKNLLKRLQKNLHNFKTKSKKEKYAILIYMFLSLIWNTLSVLLILFIAKLNNTLIECIFILSSFWLSKRTFGKAFHLSSMAQCFIVSNVTYYVLNRITTPLGISILVPIMLGVGLSYVTSKLTKKLYKPLYRGMPKDLFEETILKVEDKFSIKYNICYEYYIEKKMAINLSLKYHYSEAGIRKILKVVNNKIKELNK